METTKTITTTTTTTTTTTATATTKVPHPPKSTIQVVVTTASTTAAVTVKVSPASRFNWTPEVTSSRDTSKTALRHLLPCVRARKRKHVHRRNQLVRSKSPSHLVRKRSRSPVAHLRPQSPLARKKCRNHPARRRNRLVRQKLVRRKTNARKEHRFWRLSWKQSRINAAIWVQFLTTPARQRGFSIKRILDRENVRKNRPRSAALKTNQRTLWRNGSRLKILVL